MWLIKLTRNSINKLCAWLKWRTVNNCSKKWQTRYRWKLGCSFAFPNAFGLWNLELITNGSLRIFSLIKNNFREGSFRISGRYRSWENPVLPLWRHTSVRRLSKSIVSRPAYIFRRHFYSLQNHPSHTSIIFTPSRHFNHIPEREWRNRQKSIGKFRFYRVLVTPSIGPRYQDEETSLLFQPHVQICTYMSSSMCVRVCVCCRERIQVTTNWSLGPDIKAVPTSLSLPARQRDRERHQREREMNVVSFVPQMFSPSFCFALVVLCYVYFLSSFILCFQFSLRENLTAEKRYLPIRISDNDDVEDDDDGDDDDDDDDVGSGRKKRTAPFFFPRNEKEFSNFYFILFLESCHDGSLDTAEMTRKCWMPWKKRNCSNLFEKKGAKIKLIFLLFLNNKLKVKLIFAIWAIFNFPHVFIKKKKPS